MFQPMTGELLNMARGLGGPADAGRNNDKSKKIAGCGCGRLDFCRKRVLWEVIPRELKMSSRQQNNIAKRCIMNVLFSI